MEGDGYSKAGLLEILQNLSMFNGIDASELVKLIEQGELLHYARGQVIFREGEKATTPFCLIVQGMVSLSKTSRCGKVFTVDWRYKNDTLAWGEIIRGGNFCTSFMTLEDAYILAFNRDSFLDFLSQNRIVESRLADAHINLVGKLYNKLIDYKTDTASNRLIRTLILLCNKSGSTIDLTHQEIAEMAWTTVETATRVLCKLKNHGVIFINRGQIIVPDCDKLHLYIDVTCDLSC